LILDDCPEALHPDDFVAELVREVDDHAAQSRIPEIWREVLATCGSEDEIRSVILHRLIKGYHQEIYVRDVAFAMLQRAPSLRAQEALMRQVDDEHRHAIWVGGMLRKRGVDPAATRPSEEVEILWDSLRGCATQEASFFTSIAATQLVVERGFGLQSTAGFAEAVAPHDPEVASLYLDKIRRDELFHTIGLPEGLIREYATTAAQQNAIRRGVRKGRRLLRLLEADARSSTARR
jgi:hypothetical protein